ncbi:MAG TPA: class I SAM-dependent methyltransferase [Agromyces sp.]
MAGRDELSTSFGAAAAAYQAGRPDYPREAVDWMLAPVHHPGRALRAADVGAGTGKLTRTMVEAGAEVVAIDPDPTMLQTLRASVHGVPTFVGTAERMPLPDAALDAVLLGQAWHWVDPGHGSAETARVLRSGGVLGLVWNIRDESVPWVAELTAAMHGSHAEQLLASGGPVVADPYGAAEYGRWEWSRELDRRSLVDMAASRSYVITAEEQERGRILAAVDALFDRHHRVTAGGASVIDLPYVTHAYRFVRP